MNQLVFDEDAARQIDAAYRIEDAVRRRGRPAPSGPPTARDVADLVRRMAVERKVAQLFLVGFRGTDASAEIFRRLARLDLGGLVLQLLGEAHG